MRFSNLYTNSNFEAIKIEIQKPQADYASAKEQSRRLDSLLGFKCNSIEERLFETHRRDNEKHHQFWFGLDIQSLQTPYSEIVSMIEFLNPQSGELWLDLGAAYGRIGIVLGFLKPNVKFVGYEWVPERVAEGQRIYQHWNLQQATLKRANLASKDFELGEADLYFLYDFGSKKDVYKALDKLREIAQRKPVRVIARGRGLRNWIPMDFPWLSQIQPPIAFENWTLFQS